ncbi:MAG: GAF domain-containing protein [Anaerolineae bacterium]|nr:GAF domain-containing protein [Anaerolineae bacterium]
MSEGTTTTPASADRRRPALQPRDLIFLGMTAVVVVLFVARSLSVGLLGNLQILAISMSTIGIVAAGQTLVVITGSIDLSVGSLVALTGVITATLLRGEAPIFGPFHPIAAVIAGLGIATGIGWIQGTLIGHFRLTPFIVTFGGLSLFRGLAQVISSGAPVNLPTNDFEWLWSRAFGILSVPFVLMIITFVAVALALKFSRFGRYAYAIGGNENVAHLSGINVVRMRQMVHAVMGFLAGLAGILVMSRIHGGTYGNGQGYELYSLAAVVIGGTSLAGGTGGVWGTLLGLLLISMVSQGLFLYSVPPLWTEVIIGAFIVGAALIDLQRRRQWLSTPPVMPPAPPPAQAHTLDHAIDRLMHTVQEQYGYSLVNVYLIDRETDTLVDPKTHSPAASPLARRAAEVREALYVNDVRREPHQVAPMQPGVLSAAAAPICSGPQVIGVIEVQHKNAQAFAGVALRSLVSPALAEMIERNWLLESGWLSLQVRDSLRRLSDRVFLEKCPLGDWLLPNVPPYNRGVRLQELLRDAIASLQPDQADPQSRTARRHHILCQTYLDQKNVDAIIQDLGLSRRQYFYDLKEAVEAITHIVAGLRRE